MFIYFFSWFAKFAVMNTNADLKSVYIKSIVDYQKLFFSVVQLSNREQLDSSYEMKLIESLLGPEVQQKHIK